MTGITTMPGMTRLKGWEDLNKKFKDIFSRTHFPFFKDSNQRLESMSFNVLLEKRFVVFTFL